MIKFVDLDRQRKNLKSDINLIIKGVIEEGQFISGKEVSYLERSLEDYTKSPSVTVANGTDALSIALMSLDVKPGDEVILPSFTWVSTAEVVCLLGAVPVFADIDRNFNIDINKLKSKITNKTRVIMPVSMFGRCPDLLKIQELAQKYNLNTIEDAAQSFGAKSNNNFSCTVLDISTTSFFPSKPLGCYGDGGAVFSRNEEFLRKIKTIPKHGQVGRYNYVEVGMNSRLDTMQAAILLEKLKIFEDEITKRNNVAKTYEKHLSRSKSIETPEIPSSADRSVWAQYTVLLDGDLADKRDHIMKNLRNLGIPTALYYPVPLHTSPVYKNFNSEGLNVTSDIAKRVLSLPMHPYLSEEELSFICENLLNVIDEIS